MRCLNVVFPTAKEIRLLRVGLSGMILHFSDRFVCGNTGYIEWFLITYHLHM